MDSAGRCLWSGAKGAVGPTHRHVRNRGGSNGSRNPLFFPSWEILPQDSRLPHVDVIGDRLETLMALVSADAGSAGASPIVVTSITALLQKTFQRGNFTKLVRTLTKSDQVDPLDLVEWLEAAGYEPEAQVTQKGEIALRGGILDLFPLTSPGQCAWSSLGTNWNR